MGGEVEGRIGAVLAAFCWAVIGHGEAFDFKSWWEVGSVPARGNFSAPGSPSGGPAVSTCFPVASWGDEDVANLKKRKWEGDSQYWLSLEGNSGCVMFFKWIPEASF